MMGMILFWRYPSDSGTASASSTASAGFAPSNVQKRTVQKVWKSGSTLATEYHDMDFGTNRDIDTFSAFGHDFLSTDTISLEYADDAAFTVNVETIPLTWHENYLFETFTEITKRYRRLKVVKTLAATSRKVGRIMSGLSYEMEHGLKTPGDAHGPGRTTSKTDRTTGGQLYSNIGVTMDVMRGQVPGMDFDDAAEVLELMRTYQTAVPFVCVLRRGLTGEDVLYGTFDSMAPLRYIAPELQSMNWRMTEQK